MRMLLPLLALALASPGLADSGMIDIPTPAAEKAFVLMHPSRGTAFVRTGDAATFDRLVAEGYEVVARRDAGGRATPVTGDVIPAEIARAERLSALEELRGRRSLRDILDIGAGINLGITTGGKIRLLGTFENGFTAGIDLDVGTVLFVTDYTVSAILGYGAQAGRHVLRPYVTLGAGWAQIWAIWDTDQAYVFHAGAGFEWKPARWFGLGLEGGIEHLDYEHEESSVNIPFVRLNILFYVL